MEPVNIKNEVEMKRSPIRKISAKRLKKMREFNKNVPPAHVLGITVCPECGEKADFRGIQRSHIISKGRGGSDERSNIEYKCAKCHFVNNHGLREV